MTGPPRLSERTLAALPAEVGRPGYERADLLAGVVHIGPGAFHRAHQAPVFDDLARAGDLRWGITAIALRTGAARLALGPQDGLYTLSLRGGAEVRRRVIGSLRRVIGPGEADLAAEALAHPLARIVTATITEAGYAPRAPAALLLARGLDLRRRTGAGGMTVIACDNLHANGQRLAEVVLEAAGDLDRDLARWIADSVAFPNTMVDRITPATTAADIAALAEAIGVADEGAVAAEPFSQWVIEDRFAAARPDLAAADVQLVADVAPFERAKLRLLNGAHSAMAWLGGLAGLPYVHAFVDDPRRRAFVERLWDELAVTLAPSPDIDLPAYRAALMRRFANRGLPHSLSQIAADSAHKIGPRLLAPLGELRALGRPSPTLMTAVAAWIAWLSRRLADPAGGPLNDARAADLIRILDPSGSPLGRVRALAALGLFDASLSADLADALAALEKALPF